MINQLLLATLMVVITVLIHGAGIAWLARWRLVSAIERVNGILSLGWPTAFFVTTVARLRR